MKKIEDINPSSIVKFAAIVSAFSLSTTAIAGERMMGGMRRPKPMEKRSMK